MSGNSFLVDSGSKGWCNLFAQNVTAYSDLNVGGNIVQNGNIVNLPNANNDIEVKDLTAHGQVTLLNDNNNNGDIAFQVFDGQGDSLMVVDAANNLIGLTNTEVDGNLTANQLIINDNAFIAPDGDIGTLGAVECGSLQVGNNSSIINKFDSEDMNLNIPINTLVSQATTIGFSAFRMGNISAGGHSLVNIIINTKDDIQTNNAGGIITLTAIPTKFRPTNKVSSIVTVLDASASDAGEVKAVLDVNGVITISLFDGGNLTGNGTPIEILTNIVFTFNQIGV